MFTGIINHIVKVSAVRYTGGGIRLTVENPFADVQMGESIAIDGVCLTVEGWDAAKKRVTFFVSKATKDSTTLGRLRPGGIVNMERSLAVGDRIGGHIVSGHVDCTGRVVSIKKSAAQIELGVLLPSEKAGAARMKASIAIDGISLTVQSVSNQRIGLIIVPYTWENTNLKNKRVGDFVNIEFERGVL